MGCLFTFVAFTLVPSDLHFFFSYLKTGLSDDHFTSPATMINAVHEFVQNQAAQFYYPGLSKLLTRYNKCTDIGGDYVKK